MKQRKNIIERISSGKGFYITAALSFIMIVAAIAFVYNSSVNMIEDLNIPKITEEDETHEQVEKNQQDVEDPRVTSKESTTTQRTAESTTAVTTTFPTTQATTRETTQAAPAYSNESYVYPLTSEIGKDYSESPVYDETMEDWRIHRGIDFLAEKGSDVASIGNGKVSKVIVDTSWGYTIEVDYGEFTARYCGIQQGTAVGIDDVVSKGDIIGKLGDIPCESKQESHLHFEIVKDGKHVDPLKALKKG